MLGVRRRAIHGAKSLERDISNEQRERDRQLLCGKWNEIFVREETMQEIVDIIDLLWSTHVQQ